MIHGLHVCNICFTGKNACCWLLFFGGEGVFHVPCSRFGHTQLDGWMTRSGRLTTARPCLAGSYRSGDFTSSSLRAGDVTQTVEHRASEKY